MLPIIIDFGTLEIFSHSLSLRVYGYGLMMVLGFITAITLARWRARRAGEDPDNITQLGILSLIAGVAGARIAYVIQHWDQIVTDSANPLFAVLNISSGGLIYYGGLILAGALGFAYLLVKRLPLRRYLDMLAPSLMVGLAFGRMGCLLNGCCYGGICSENWPLAARFPMYSTPLVKVDGRDNPFSLGTNGPSPAYYDQFDRGAVEPDARLVNQLAMRKKTKIKAKGGGTDVLLLPPRDLHGKLDGDQLGFLSLEQSRVGKLFADLAGSDGYLSADEWRLGLADGDGLLSGSESWEEARRFARFRADQLNFDEMWQYILARRDAIRGRFDRNADGSLDIAERSEANAFLQADQIALARSATALPVKPAQALGIVNALLLAGILMAFYPLRRREGQVFALLMVLYPITRFLLESIRDDNPHDLLRGVLTHNQYTSIIMLVGGLLAFYWLRRLPKSAGAIGGVEQNSKDVVRNCR